MYNIKLSIIKLSYNRVNLIGETLEFIMAQTHKNWECLVIDDGSTDNTFSIFREYSLADPRIKYFQRPETHLKGPSGCRNYGLGLSTGKYINWFDSDDLMSESKLSLEIAILENCDADFTISQTQFFDRRTEEKLGFWNDTLYSDDAINDFIMLKIGWSTNAPLWRRSSLESKALLFNETLMGPDDYDFHIRALHSGMKPKVLNEVHVLNRVHPNRIENIRSKAHPKALIILDLLNNKDSYKLSKACVESQKHHALYLIKNMYKNKNWSDGTYFSFRFYRMFPNFFHWQVLTGLMFTGLLYKITNRGYNLIENT